MVFTIIRDVEKEVVLADPASSVPQSSLNPSLTPTVSPMDVDQPPSPPDVLKVIKKFEVNVLCAQHNPVRWLCVPLIECTKINFPRLWLLPNGRTSRTRYGTSSWHSQVWRASRYASAPGCSRYLLSVSSKKAILWRSCGIGV